MYPTVYKDSRGGHNRTPINQKFFQTWSPQMAYVLGFIFADGAIEDVQKSSRACYVVITSRDIVILESIKKFMSSKHNLYKRLPQLITFPNGKTYLTDEEFTLRIGSKSMYNDLLGLGVTPRKSLTIQFPNIPPQYLSSFIRGYFDGDGCLYMIKKKYPRIVFTSGSYEFLKGLSLALSQTLQIPIKLVYTQMKEKNPCYQLHYNTTIGKKILEFMYKNLEEMPYLERKFAIYQRFLEKMA